MSLVLVGLVEANRFKGVIHEAGDSARCIKQQN